MIAKNERTKAMIKKRDEDRKAKQDKMLEESAHITSYFIAQKKQQFDYCTARGNFGDKE